MRAVHNNLTESTLYDTGCCGCQGAQLIDVPVGTEHIELQVRTLCVHTLWAPARTLVTRSTRTVSLSSEPNERRAHTAFRSTPTVPAGAGLPGPCTSSASLRRLRRRRRPPGRPAARMRWTAAWSCSEPARPAPVTSSATTSPRSAKTLSSLFPPQPSPQTGAQWAIRSGICPRADWPWQPQHCHRLI